MSGLDNNTILLLHCEDFTDHSFNKRTITNNGASIVKEGKFGNGMSLGSNQYISISNGMQNVDLSKDFTMEWWEYSTGDTASTGSVPGVFTNRSKNTSTGGNGLLIGHAGTKIYTSNVNGSWNGISGAIFKDKVDNVWVHWRLVKKGDVWTSYKNGHQFWSLTNSVVPGKTDGDNCTIGASVTNNINVGYNAIIDEFKISNIALCDGDFEPPTRPYNSIDINITNQTDDKIDFNISKLGQEVVNKIEVLVNGQVFKTYDNIGDLTYDIDKSLLFNGNNKIKIKVTFDNDYSEEKEIDYEYVINNLSTSSSLKELIDRQELLTDLIEDKKNNLKSILESKNVVVSEEENKLSILINKVNELGSSNMLYLYNNGIFKNYDYNILKIGNVYGDSVINNNCINLKVNTTSSSQWSYIGLSSTNAIDVSEYNKLNIKVKYNKFSPNGSSSIETLATLRNENSLDTDKVTSVKVTSMNVNSEYIYSLDISNLNGSYVCQFVIGAYMVVSILDVDIYQVWLEK